MRAQVVAIDRDAGFTLLEAVVATFVVILLFAGFGRAMGASFGGAMGNRAAQEATAVAVSHLEFARSLAWDEIAMPHVPTGTPMVDRATYHLVGAEADLPTDEALVVDGGGLLAPMAVESVDGTSYTVWTIVSSVGPGLRRVVVLVVWEVEGAVTNYRTSTLIAEAATR